MSSRALELALVEAEEPGRIEFTRSRLEPAQRRLERPTSAMLATLSAVERRRFNVVRNDAHLNMRPIATVQGTATLDELKSSIRAAGQHRVGKPILVLHGEANRGKTVTGDQLARYVYEEQLLLWGPFVDDRFDRFPVISVSLDATQVPTPKQVLRLIAVFLGIPGWTAFTADELLWAVRRWVRNHDVQLLIIDELHFVSTPAALQSMSSFLKSLIDELPVTILAIGIGLDAFVNELNRSARPAQMAERALVFELGDVPTRTPRHRASWIEFLLGLEQRLLLADVPPGSIANEAGLWILGRAGHRIGTAFDLVIGAAFAAIDSGRERLRFGDLEQVKLKAGAAQRQLHHLQVPTTVAEIDAWVRSGQLPRSAEARRLGRGPA